MSWDRRAAKSSGFPQSHGILFSQALTTAPCMVRPHCAGPVSGSVAAIEVNIALRSRAEAVSESFDLGRDIERRFSVLSQIAKGNYQGEDVETPDLKALARLAHGESIERVSATAFRITRADPSSKAAVAHHCAEARLDSGITLM